jgi:hypothetical protein
MKTPTKSNYPALKNAYESDWRKHYPYYFQLFTDRPPEKREELAKLHAQNLAYWLELVNITGGTWKRHGALKTAFELHLKCMTELYITSNLRSYHRFTVFLSKIRKGIQENTGIENTIIHRNNKNIN